MMLAGVIWILLFQEAVPLLNPNTATKVELMATDKIVTEEIADKIIAGRPYASYRDVQKVIGAEVWDKLFNLKSDPPPPPTQPKKIKPYNPALPLPKDVG